MSESDIMDRLAAANPVPAQDLDRFDSEAGERLAEEIRRTPRVVGWRMPRRRVLTGAALVALVGGAGTAVVWPGGAAYAVTPQMLTYRPDNELAGDVLNRLAERAERGPVPASGRFDYVQLQSFYLHTASQSGTSSSAVQVVKEEHWLAADASGRTVTVSGELRMVGSGSAGTADAVTYQDTADSDQRYGPGQLGGVADLSAMSTDPARLADQLATDRTAFGWSETAPGAPDWYRRVAVVTGIAKQQTVPPHLWAAMLRVLASTPGLDSQGTVTDRVGRPAVAVSFDTTHDGGRPTRFVLLFDPDTGAYLGEEHILTTKIGDGPYDERLNVKIPAVMKYRTVVAAGTVATDQERLPEAGR